VNKRIDIVAVSTEECNLICTAPYMSLLYTGDFVEVEGVAGFATVLIRDSVELGSKDFEVLDTNCLLRRILRKVDFTEMNWDGYEEVEVEKMLAFDTAVVTESGMAYGHYFKEGEVYPVLGSNNGVQIGYCDSDQTNYLLCHSFGKVQAPVDAGLNYSDDEKFSHQDGSIPPLFEYCKLKIK
jgi:hypothetical protein